jgi:hypothetical protein
MDLLALPGRYVAHGSALPPLPSSGRYLGCRSAFPLLQASGRYLEIDIAVAGICSSSPAGIN